MATHQSLEPAAVTEIHAKIRDLLKHARTIKTANGVEPALSTSDFGKECSTIYREFLSPLPEDQRQTALEISARKIFYDVVSSITSDEAAFTELWNLLDILVIFCEVEEKLGLNLPWVLIEELVESQTTDSCRLIFDYLEARRERLIQRNYPAISLVVLRTCNELLKRLSRAEDPAFCGRVFFYLFQVFPLGDHSATNMRGEFHVDNVTTFEEESESLPLEDGAADVMDVESVPQIAKDTTSAKDKVATQQPVTMTPADAVEKQNTSEFYSTFWRLQQDFSVPTRLFQDEHFKVFKSGLEETLIKFGATTVVQTKTSAEEPRGLKRKLGDEGKSKYHDTYNPKYLTSRDLFELELSDLTFQRHIFVQTLIVIDFLLSLTEAAKKKMDLDSLSRVNRSVVYSYALTEEKVREQG